MATIWTLSSTKGGCGKTTLAALLAGEAVRKGAEVTLVDTDPNQPLVAWAAKGNLPDQLQVIGDTDKSGHNLTQLISELRQSSRFIIIDTEGTDNLRSGVAMQIADLVIIPAKWSELDTNQALKVENFLKVAEASLGRTIPSVIVPSQVETTFETRNTRILRAELEARGTQWIDPPVLSKDVFRAIFTQGRLLQDVETTSTSRSLETARDNVQAVARAIAQASLHQTQTI